MGVRKYYFKKPLPRFTPAKSKDYLKENVFETNHFDRHIKKVSSNLNIDERIIRDVVEDYFTNVFILVNTIRKFKTKINIFGFCSLEVMKGDRF